MNQTAVYPLLKYSAFAGILSIFIYAPLLLLEFSDIFDNFSVWPLLLILILSILSDSFFMAGFIYLGHKTDNKLLQISSLLFLLVGMFDDFTIFLGNYNKEIDLFFESLVVAGVAIIIYGLLGTMHGISTLKLAKNLGPLAKKTGIIELILSISLLTIIFSPIAILLIIPLYIFQAKLLLKASSTKF